MIFFLLFSQNKALPFAMVKNFGNFLNEKKQIAEIFHRKFSVKKYLKENFPLPE